MKKSAPHSCKFSLSTPNTKTMNIWIEKKTLPLSPKSNFSGNNIRFYLKYVLCYTLVQYEKIDVENIL